MYKKCKIVKLPIDKYYNAIYWHENKLYTDLPKGADEHLHHLYITSDTEIKEDFTGHAIATVRENTKPKLNYLVEVIAAEKNQCYCKGDHKFSYKYYSVKPIIAATDTSLVIGWDYKNDIPNGDDYNKFLPQPTKEFIQKFVEEYNRDNIITDVMVEYVGKIHNQFSGANAQWIEYIIKISSDNTINIKPVKNTYSREEVIELLHRVAIYGASTIFITKDDINKWIENNL